MSDEPIPIRIPEQGRLLIRDLEVTFNEDGDREVTNFVVELSTDVWQHWLKEAEDAARRAEDARASNPGLEGGADFDHAVIAELRASMAAATAAACALEAFRDSIVLRTPTAEIDADSAAGRVHQTVLRVFSFANEQRTQLRNDIGIVFTLRNSAVHSSSAFDRPALHPVFQVGMEKKYVNFRAENARGCADIARSVINECLKNPRAKFPDLVAWATGARDRGEAETSPEG